LATYRNLAVARSEEFHKQVPRVGFDNIEAQASSEQPADHTVPLALRQAFRPGVGFVATPVPTSPDPATVSLLDEKYSFVTHVETQWRGRKAVTAAYVSLPVPKGYSAGDYLIGPENDVVLVHLHGGGTPTATGKNAMSIGEKLAPRGLATLALDLPGHGIATKNPDGLLDFESQVDFLLQQIEQLVHPGVKVVLSGHSWGGAIAVYMHRHSNEPKYARIERFLALSPPVDVTLGGDAKSRSSSTAGMKRISTS
ncbi:MAG: alpha/beta fold hydrolase, partial [Calothrix sp. SM1_5_4]|nr:alpha/beta fold hydrolase [Calothrix sp. SM1_5_4]